VQKTQCKKICHDTDLQSIQRKSAPKVLELKGGGDSHYSDYSSPVLEGHPVDLLDSSTFLKKNNSASNSIKSSLGTEDPKGRLAFTPNLHSLGDVLTDKDKFLHSELLQEILEESPSFQESLWKNLDSKHGGTMYAKPVEDREFGEDLIKCRAYKSTITIKNLERSISGIGCRDDSGKWFFLE
jgi:surface antigen